MNNLPGSMSKYLLIFLSAVTLVITVGCSTPRTKPANVIDRSGNSAESTPPGYYRVKRGDTLTRIALDHGQAPRDLVIWNKLANPNQIEIGDLILIQPPGKTKSAAAMSAPILKSETIKPDGSSVEAAKEVAADSTIVLSWPAKGKVIEEFSEKNKGIDIAGRLGEPILAASNGKVVYAGNSLRGYGELVIVKHDNTYLTAYAHNRILSVKEGQMVKKGQKIAEMGDTDSSSIKLHFELRVNGKPVNPMPYLQ